MKGKENYLTKLWIFHAGHVITIPIGFSSFEERAELEEGAKNRMDVCYPVGLVIYLDVLALLKVLNFDFKKSSMIWYCLLL